MARERLHVFGIKKRERSKRDPRYGPHEVCTHQQAPWRWYSCFCYTYTKRGTSRTCSESKFFRDTGMLTMVQKIMVVDQFLNANMHDNPRKWQSNNSQVATPASVQVHAWPLNPDQKLVSQAKRPMVVTNVEKEGCLQMKIGHGINTVEGFVGWTWGGG